MRYKTDTVVWKLSLPIIAVLSMAGYNPTAVADEAGSAENSAATPDFGRDLTPIFAKNCSACHNAKKSEGGLNLESYSALMQGGDSGAAVEASNVDAGQLLVRIVDTDAPMPPDDNSVGANRLTEAEVALLRQWVQAGAPAPQMSSTVKLRWQPIPKSVQPIYALAASPDGNYVAFGRGNQAFVLNRPAVAANDLAYPLVDPSVGKALQSSDDSHSLIAAAHLDIVQSLAFSPDSQLIATGGYRSVKIWRRETAAVGSLATGIKPTIGGPGVAISRDGQRLAAADQSQLEIVDLRTAQSHRFLKAHAHSVSTLAWLDGSDELLSCDSTGTFVLTNAVNLVSRSVDGSPLPACARLLSLGKGRLLAVDSQGQLFELTIGTEGSKISARSIEGMMQVTALAAPGTETGLIAIGLASGVCRLISPADLTLVREIATAGPITDVAVSPNSAWVVTTSGATAAQLWKTEDGSAVATLDRDYHYNLLGSTARRSTARQQAMLDRLANTLTELGKASEAETAARDKVQEARNKAAEELAAKETAMTAASQAVTTAQTAKAEAEAALAEAMKLVETRKTELEASEKAAVEATNQKTAATEELAKRDQALATAQDATVRALARVPEMEQKIVGEKQRLESLANSAQEIANAPQAKHQARVLGFSADSSRAVVGDEAGHLHLFSTQDGATEAKLKTDGSTIAIAVASEGQLVSVSSSGVAQQWDLQLPWKLWTTIGSFEESPFSDRITALAFSPDGSRLAVGSGPPSRFGEIKIVQVETGQVAIDLGEAHSDTVLALRFSPDGRHLASAGADKLCRIFDAQTGQLAGALEGHTHHVLSLGWKDDGLSLATGSADNSVKVWNVESGTQSRTIAGFKKEITALTFVGPSDQFVAVDASGVAQLIEAGSGKQVRAFAGADGALVSVDVSSDGKYLFAGGQSGKSWVWQIEDGKLLK